MAVERSARAQGDLLDLLLTRRSALTNQVIVDTLALWRLQQQLQPWERVPADVMARQLEVSVGCPSYVSKRLMNVVRAGLLHYEAGDRGEPGYLIHRVGPK